MCREEVVPLLTVSCLFCFFRVVVSSSSVSHFLSGFVRDMPNSSVVVFGGFCHVECLVHLSVAWSGQAGVYVCVRAHVWLVHRRAHVELCSSASDKRLWKYSQRAEETTLETVSGKGVLE